MDAAATELADSILRVRGGSSGSGSVFVEMGGYSPRARR